MSADGLQKQPTFSEWGASRTVPTYLRDCTLHFNNDDNFGGGMTALEISDATFQRTVKRIPLEGSHALAIS